MTRQSLRLVVMIMTVVIMTVMLFTDRRPHDFVSYVQRQRFPKIPEAAPCRLTRANAFRETCKDNER